MAVLTSELRAWLTPGKAGMVAAVDPSGQPQITRVWAVRAHDQRDELEVYVLRAAALAVLDALANGGRAALNLIEVSNYRSRMFKGACEISPFDADSAFLDESLAALNRVFVSVGMAPASAERMLGHADAPHAMVALRLQVDSVFDQSPKPGAGARL
jgi:hypothetical protein